VIGDCLLGIVSALTVPLFLNMISSNLLTFMHKKPVNLFIFNGICLLFALFSCRLKENVFNKRFQATGSIPRDHGNADPVETDYDLKIGSRKVSKDRLGRAGISESELKILQVMASGNHVHQSLVGLLKDPELEKEPVNETLSSVMAKGLVEQKLNKENKLRLYLTPKGKQILDKF
jgi:predicted transcriptional regulator